jgi:EAL domain-containing protein (putative c-di-GMP-specific phosphodiesterase class I)/ActR/RegA family two-component response regulator
MAVANRSRLLILEDDPAVGRVIRDVATAEGHEALILSKPDQFFTTLEVWQPTHIVLDLVMPERDGIEILAELGARRCALRIIITSGMGSGVLDAAAHDAREHGLNIIGLLAKPFSPSALRALLAPPAGSSGPSNASGGDAAATAPNLSEAEFRSALQRQEFAVHYLPKVDCRRGRLVGFEALVRWPRAQGHLMMPGEFISFAETHGFIDALTSLVLDQALAWFGPRFVAGRTDSYIAPSDAASSDISLSINLSATSLRDMRVVEHSAAACLRHQVPTAQVIFELTETGAMDGPVGALAALTRLRTKGFQLSIDDFGIRHSSMRQLMGIPFTEIKVDKSFVMSAAQSNESRTVVRSIVDWARDLGLKSVGEGVEDADTHSVLQEMGCDFAQGYWIGRPMTGDAVPAWLAAKRPVL